MMLNDLQQFVALVHDDYDDDYDEDLIGSWLVETFLLLLSLVPLGFLAS